MIWKNIEGYGYEISENGIVRNIKTGKHLKLRTMLGGYLGVQLYKDGKRKSFYVHRLVAHAFVNGHSEENHVVNHLDGNKLNNHRLNLEWTTHAKNLKHALETGLRRQYSKYDYEDILESIENIPLIDVCISKNIPYKILNQFCIRNNIKYITKKHSTSPREFYVMNIKFKSLRDFENKTGANRKKASILIKEDWGAFCDWCETLPHFKEFCLK